MAPKTYEYLLEMNRGYDLVVCSLKALAKYPVLKPEEIRRFEQLAREGCAATNTHLLDVLSALRYGRFLPLKLLVAIRGDRSTGAAAR